MGHAARARSRRRRPARQARCDAVRVAWVGTSGWSTTTGTACSPAGTRRRSASTSTREFDTVEVRREPLPMATQRVVREWRRRLPAGFRMSVKAPRGLTHAKKLYCPRSGWSGSRRRGTSPTTGAPCCSCRRRRPWNATTRAWAGSSTSAVVGPGRRRAAPPQRRDEEVFGLLERHGASYCVMSGRTALSCGRPRRSCTCGCTAVPRLAVRRLVLRRRGASWWADRIREWEVGSRGLRVLQQRRERERGAQRARRLRELLRGW